MTTPAIIMLVLMGISLGIGMVNHKKPQVPTSFWIILTRTSALAGLLYMGGFFA